MAEKPPSGGYGSSSDPALPALLSLVRKYGAVEKIPQQLLLNIGRTRAQAVATFSNYVSLNTGSKSKGGSPVSPANLALANSLAQQFLGAAPSNNPVVKVMGSSKPGKSVDYVNKNTGPYPVAPNTSRGQDSWDRGNKMPKAAPVTISPTANFQDSDKANRARITPAPTTSTARGQDSWDRAMLNQPTDNLNDVGSIISAPQFLAPPPQPKPFTFKLNDFTNKANQMAAAAYSPQLAAVERAKANVGTNYDISSKIVQGLYNDLLDRISQNTQQIQQNYANAQAANTQAGNDLTSAIGDTYASSQNQLADLLTKIGAGDQAAAAALPQGAADQAYQQSRALNNTQAQADALTSQGQAANDFQGAVSNAQAAQGAFQQQDLLRQKNNDLQNWDWQSAQLAGQQAQQALSLAQQLTGQDLNLQQLNYGVGQDAYNNQLKGIGLSNDQMQQEYQNRLAAMNAAAQQVAAQNSNALDWAKFNYGVQQDTQNFDYRQQQDMINNELERQRINAQFAPKAPEVTDVFGKLNNTLEQVAPGRAGVLKSLAENVLSTLDPADPALKNPQALSLLFQQAAINLNRSSGAGITPDEASRAAGVYAQSGIFGK